MFEWLSCAIGAVNNITTSLFVSIYRAKWGGGGGGGGGGRGEREVNETYFKRTKGHNQKCKK